MAPGSMADALARYAFAYLVTTKDTGSAHVVAVTATLAGDLLRVAELGPTTRANIAARPRVTLIWPPDTADGFSMIVDGSGSLDGDAVLVSPTRAVLHRRPPGHDHAAGGCAVNCRELPTAGTSADAGRLTT